MRSSEHGFDDSVSVFNAIGINSVEHLAVVPLGNVGDVVA